MSASVFDPIPLLTPLLPERKLLQPYLDRIDASRHYSNFGPLNQALEQRLAEFFAPHSAAGVAVVTTSSATTGLELSLASLELAPGSRVLVPALTFVATLTAVLRAGLVPVVCDIDPSSWLLTPEIAEAALAASGARAVMPVAAFGQPVDTLAWSRFQQRHGVKVVVDAAGAFGSQWVAASDIPMVFSMHATKTLAAGEGGMVVCGNSAQLSSIKQMSNFGINLDPQLDLAVGTLSRIGSNAKLSEYHAAVAHASLDGWHAQAAQRSEIYAAYRQALESRCGERLQWQAGQALAAPTLFCIRLPDAASRERLEQQASSLGVATRRWYQPLLHQHGEAVQPLVVLPTPNAEKVASGLIGLPFSCFINHTQIQYIADIVSSAVTNLSSTSSHH